MNTSQDEKYVYRYYKISINIWPLSFNFNTNTHEILRGPLPYLMGFGYSLITIFLGFFGGLNGMKNAFEALQINITGGQDISKEVLNFNFDNRTIYIHNNLTRQTFEKTDLELIHLLTEIQEHYLESHSTKYDDANCDFIIANLAKLKIFRLTQSDVKDVFDAMRLHDRHLLESSNE